MLLSLFTPTNNPAWLGETYRSLRWQSHQDWEWVIVPNGGATIPSELLADPRVRVVGGGEQLTHVGALKRFACKHCRGQAYIEMDHDDLLVPGVALAAIHLAFEQGAGFVFSDAAVFDDGTMRSYPYAASHGWRSYPVKVYGRTFHATQAFPLTPRSLCEVYYAPDHVRAWSRRAYEATGGHNEGLSVGDDHDLVCRTYLAGEKFAHTGGCHYLYRMHLGNTVKHRQELIRKQTAENRRQYTTGLIKQWCRRQGHAELDINTAAAEGWSWEKDLAAGGFGQDRFGAIWCHNVLQRCPSALVPAFMQACYQALIPGGYLEIVVPDGARFLDPQALTHFSENSFQIYCNRELKAFQSGYPSRFQCIQSLRVPYGLPDHLGALYLKVQLTALKGQWHPASQLI